MQLAYHFAGQRFGDLQPELSDRHTTPLPASSRIKTIISLILGEAIEKKEEYLYNVVVGKGREFYRRRRSGGLDTRPNLVLVVPRSGASTSGHPGLVRLWRLGLGGGRGSG